MAARTRKTRAERIEAIKAQLEQLQARESTERRKQDTRCKIIIGSTVLGALDDDPQLAAMVRKLMIEQVTRETDRKVIAHLL